MPVQVSYPGVYLEELPSNTHTVTAATTSSTAFVGFFTKGPIGQAVKVNNFGDFTRNFGGLAQKSEASYAIMQYFNNGGQVAWVVRLGNGKQRASAVQPPIPVNQPTLKNLSKEASQAANSALNAAKQAQKDMCEDKPVYQIAEDVAAQTQIASQMAQDASEAADAASKELQVQLTQYEADYGAEAASTLSAAEEAALAAQTAAQAAAIASADSANAEAAAKKLQQPVATAPTNTANATYEALQKAQVMAAGVTPSTLSSSARNEIQSALGGAPGTIDYTKIPGNAAPIGTDIQTALKATQASPPVMPSKLEKQLTSALQGALNEVNQMILVGYSSTLTATEAEQRALSAISLAGANVLTPPFTQEVQSDVQSAIGATANAAAQAKRLYNSLISAQTFDVGSPPSSPPPVDLSKAIDAAQDLLDNANMASSWAQLAGSAADWLAQASDEPDSATDSGFHSALSEAATAASRAASAAALLHETGSPPYSPPNLTSDEATLLEAAKVFQSVITSTAFIDLGPTITKLKTVTENALKDFPVPFSISGPPSSPPLTVERYDRASSYAEAAQAAWLAGQIADDLQTAVTPTDQVEAAIQAAALAAENAAAAATDAALKAQIAQQAAEADEAAAEGPALTVQAANPGKWGDSLQVSISTAGLKNYEFTLQVQELGLRGGKVKVVSSETFPKLTLSDKTAKNYAVEVINASSQLIQASYPGPWVQGAVPSPTPVPLKLSGGADGGPPQANNLFPINENDGLGMEAALDGIAPDFFNLLCIPVTATYSPNAMQTAVTDAMNFAQSKQAFYIVDIPTSVDTTAKMQSWFQTYGSEAAYSMAVYYPRLEIPDPLQNYRSRSVGPSGTMAGIYARNDGAYGVWTSPAGTNAVIENATISLKVNDTDNGTLNELGINCLRTFPTYNNVVWGARTAAGADLLDSQWKYINVRRLADYIEQSLVQSLKWVVFQNNTPRLWKQITTEVGSFMSGLFSAGAFAGSSASSAYLVKCDSSTTSQTDIDNGIVNILVGFAPEYPAEFVILQIEQLASGGTGS